MNCRPYLPGDKVEYQFYTDAPAVKGTVAFIFPSGLIEVLLDTGQIVLTYHYFLKHINS